MAAEMADIAVLSAAMAVVLGVAAVPSGEATMPAIFAAMAVLSAWSCHRTCMHDEVGGEGAAGLVRLLAPAPARVLVGDHVARHMHALVENGSLVPVQDGL
jgi:hypothetical protein